MVVEDRVDEAQGPFPDLDALLHNAVDDGRKDGRRGGGAARKPESPRDVGGDIVAVRGDVGDAAAVAVVHAGLVVVAVGVVRVWRVVVLEVRSDGLGLVAVVLRQRLILNASREQINLLRGGENVGESSTAVEGAAIRVASRIVDRAFGIINSLPWKYFRRTDISQPVESVSNAYAL